MRASTGQAGDDAAEINKLCFLRFPCVKSKNRESILIRFERFNLFLCPLKLLINLRDQRGA